MALWFVTAAVVVLSFVSFTAGVSPEAEELTRTRVQAKSAWRRLGCTGLLAGIAITAGWVWWAFETGDWRYAVIGVGPLVASLARRLFQAIVWPRWAERT